ncbi:MAG TPA: glutamine--fructose-6-phosphate transaminase (isomerizing), partial [Hyphomicrobiales bacterium]|nr:glutamine--fructose-6-phosphate transaminase (isomerizing) [Hyphomicrobiales bacterium]
MCGIVGIISSDPVAPSIFEALKRLEYRGYDSAGIATLEQGRLTRLRAEGKLARLADKLERKPLSGHIGIGHTRWATHGAPTERNAHPHATERVAVVHNGIIENFRAIKQELEADGAVFETDTDTEIVAQLVTRALNEGAGPVEAVRTVLPRLEGAFALAILFDGEEDLLIAARKGSPLAVGIGRGEMFVGSDAIALAPFTEDILYLEDGDWAVLSRGKHEVFDAAGDPVDRPVRRSSASALMVDKGNYRHFMAKEIHEQPEVIGHTLAHYLDFVEERTHLPGNLPFDFKDLNRIAISACGTAFYAGLTAKYWFERLARLPVDIDIASEFRYRDVPLEPGGLALFISQSGETADTLATLRFAKANGQHIASIVNVRESTMARESEVIFPTLAGPEVGVA